MRKTLFILVALIAGIGLWFYLLLGRDAQESNIDEQAVQTSKTQNKPLETKPGTTASATSSADLPTQTDYGMEFPTLEE